MVSALTPEEKNLSTITNSSIIFLLIIFALLISSFAFVNSSPSYSLCVATLPASRTLISLFSAVLDIISLWCGIKFDDQEGPIFSSYSNHIAITALVA